jgi:hypothetical protein
METPTPEPPIPPDPLKALEEYKGLEAKMFSNWRGNDQGPEYKAHINRMHKVAAVAFAKPEPPAFVVDGKQVAETLTELTQMKALQQTFPVDSSEARALNESIIQATNKHLATLAPKSVPGVYGWEDYEKSNSAARLKPDAQREIRLRVQHAGGDPQAATLAADAVQTFLETRPHPLTQPALDYEEDYRAAAERGLTRLGYDADTIAALKADGLFHPGGQKLMGLLWHVGQG